MEQDWRLELRDSVSFITDSKPATFCSESNSISPKAVYQVKFYSLQSKDSWVPACRKQKYQSWASKTAKWVMVFATKPDGLSSVPRTYMAEGKNWLAEVTL